jgi:uncharacterized protein YjiS (DUF1127 family)
MRPIGLPRSIIDTPVVGRIRQGLGSSLARWRNLRRMRAELASMTARERLDLDVLQGNTAPQRYPS